MIKLGNTELDKKQSISLIVGILLILGAAGGYWFYGKDSAIFHVASVDEDALGDLEDEEGAEEADIFGDDDDLFGDDEDLFGEDDGNDVIDLFDEGGEDSDEGFDDLFGDDEDATSNLFDVAETETQQDIPMDVESAKEKGNIIDLESKRTLTEAEKSALPSGSLKDLLRKETDRAEVEVTTTEVTREVRDGVVVQDEMVVVKTKPIPRTTYRVRRGDTFASVAKKLGYPVSFQSKLAFLEKNPTHFQGITETESGTLMLPLRAGKTLKLPVKPLKRSWLYNRVGQNIETYVIEFYESENQASAEVIRRALMNKGIKAYIRPFARTYQVMIGFFDNKATAEKVIKDVALYFGQSDDSINLLKLTRGRDSFDDYVARERDQFYIQVFASQNEDVSKAVLRQAREIQIKNSVLVRGRSRGKNLYKIQVGYFNSRFEAVIEAKFLKHKIPEITDFFIRKGKMQGK